MPIVEAYHARLLVSYIGITIPTFPLEICVSVSRLPDSVLLEEIAVSKTGQCFDVRIAIMTRVWTTFRSAIASRSVRTNDMSRSYHPEAQYLTLLNPDHQRYMHANA